MPLLHDDQRPDLEAGVRSMLHRLAADVGERPPAWEDLVARHEAVVVPLGVPASVARARDPHPGRGRRPRLSLAAAAVLVLAVAGALIVDRTGSEPTGGPAAETISVVSPGDASFDAGAATAVWATGIDDPVAATAAYLGAMGVPMGTAAPPAMVLRTTGDATAAVEWSLPAAPGAGGTVYLRSASGTGAAPSWTVVGAAAADVALEDVRYDGTEVSFTVARTAAEAEQLAVSAWVDGQPVSLGGDAVAPAAAGGVWLGELVDLGTAADAHGRLRLPVEADDVVMLRVVHVVDGVVRSVAHMAVALPDADPAVAATGFLSVDAGGHATGQAGAGAGGASGSAGAEAGVSGEIEPVPGLTVPTLPELPPLPTLPTLPPGSVPTLPAPPTTAPGSLPGILP